MKKITCDSCKNDLTECGPVMDYRLNLKSESIPITTGYVVDVMVYDPLPNEVNFCGFGCLKKFLESRLVKE